MTVQTKDFQMPFKLEAEKETLTKTYGKFFAEPFERGFGVWPGMGIVKIERARSGRRQVVPRVPYDRINLGIAL